jgi:hypothetical protein
MAAAILPGRRCGDAPAAPDQSRSVAHTVTVLAGPVTRASVTSGRRCATNRPASGSSPTEAPAGDEPSASHTRRFTSPDNRQAKIVTNGPRRWLGSGGTFVRNHDARERGQTDEGP